MDQAKIDAAQKRIDDEREELNKAQKKFSRVFNAQEKVIKAEAAKKSMDLEFALQVYVGDGRITNDAGYKWLQERCWKGEWRGMGISYSGHFPDTNQHCMKIMLNRCWDSQKLDEISKVWQGEIIPLLKPVVEEARSLSEMGPAVQIDIMDNDCCETRNPKLFIKQDGTVLVLDIRNFRPLDYPIYEGDFRGALTVIRNCYPYDC